MSLKNPICIITIALLSFGCVFRNQGTTMQDSNIKNQRFDTKHLLVRHGVPAGAVERLEQAMKNLNEPVIKYPWPGLAQAISNMPPGRLPLLGYGSLLNSDSAAKTIKDAPREGYPPVLALGAMRVFNYVIPPERLAVYRGAHKPREIAALNVIYTKLPSNALNGRLLMISASDIEALRRREYGYDLCPVICLHWSEWDEQPFLAYVLVASDTTVGGRMVIDNSALPNPTYARVCRAGAGQVSDNFLQIYLRTTFLSDRKTTLAEWEATHPDLKLPPDQ